MERDEGIPRVRIRDLVRYYLRLGALGFGGPVALCGQMEKELVTERQWLTKDEFRDGIAVCQSLPGPLAIQVGIYVSYLRGGFWGAWAGGWAFILPNFIIVAPILIRHRANRNVQGFVKGAYAAAIGTILGAAILLGKIAIGDWLTALVGLLSLVALTRWKINNPVLIAVTAVIGLIAFPILQPTWVFVK